MKMIEFNLTLSQNETPIAATIGVSIILTSDYLVGLAVIICDHQTTCICNTQLHLPTRTQKRK